MATLIGTPPNLIFAGQVRQLFPELGEVGFRLWTLVGVPLAGVYLLLTWGYLGYIKLRSMPKSAPAVSRQALARQRATLGPMSRGEWAVWKVLLLFGSGFAGLRPWLRHAATPDPNGAGHRARGGAVGDAGPRRP